MVPNVNAMSYSQLSFTSFSVRDFTFKHHLPETCRLCGAMTWPLTSYSLESDAVDLEVGPIWESGYCCKDCVPPLVLKVVHETEHNIEIAIHCKNEFDWHDVLFEEECDETEREHMLQDLHSMPKDERVTQLILRPLSPAYLLFRIRERQKRCDGCDSVPLLAYCWQHAASVHHGVCCDRCAFNFCGYVLGAMLENQQKAPAENPF